MAIVTIPTESVGPRFDDWQSELKAAIRDPFELCRVLELPESMAQQAREAIQDFSLFAPLAFVDRIQRSDPTDPLLLQLLPSTKETKFEAGFTTDPVDDAAATVAPGVVQKYHGRALLIATGVCAINCRYCFRRHFPYQESPKGTEQWSKSLASIRADESISEVILSGGDPLMLNDASLGNLVSQIEAIDHVKRLRIHTRLPIMIPSRVTQRLLQTLTESRLVPIVVIHCNHAAEIDSTVESALSSLVDRGIPVLNQSVLLRGINDDIETLVQLSNRLINQRVMPYYLNQLDRVQGASHFEVPLPVGQKLIAEMRHHLPGYAVPRFVSEIAGEKSKTIVG